MNDILWVIVWAILAKTFFALVLEGLNRWNLKRHKDVIPPIFQGVVDATSYQKSLDYTHDKSHFREIELLVDSGFWILIITGQWIPQLFTHLAPLFGESVWGLALTTLCIQCLMMLPSLPLDWWNQFKVEAHYGFNRSNQKLWWTDRIKGLCLMLLIGWPFIAGLLSFYNKLNDTWWIWAASFMIGFKILLLVGYPRLILPLFNRLSPMQEGDLKNKLLALANRLGFQTQKIEVIDGSKRSGHSNAFFTGFGPFRKIVFFDTLLHQLNDDELSAVLAHEIGHYRCGHILQRVALSAILTFVGFGLIDWVLQQPAFFEGLGFSPDSQTCWLPSFFIIGSLLIELIFFWISPIFSAYSRIHEYQADAFAKKAIGSPEPLICALQKLHKENLSNMVPHPIYSRFYYSHPTLVERAEALRAL